MGNYKTYEKYKPSGVEWLGEIPEHWSTIRIKFSTYVKGRIGWHGLKSDEFTDEGAYLVTGTDFENNQIDWSRCYHVSLERYAQDPYIQLKNGDLLITKDGTIGKTAIISGLQGYATLNSGIFLTRPLRQDYLPEFLCWVLNSNCFYDYVNLSQTGTTINHLYQWTFENFSFQLPPIEEQKSIACFLDHETTRIDTLITKKRQLINFLQKKREAIIHQAVTKGLDPTAPLKDSLVEWLGKIPEKWEVRKIKYITEILRGKFTHRPRNDPKLYDGEYPFIQTGDVATSGKYIAEHHQTLNSLGFSVSKEFPKGTLVMTIAANIGDLAILTFPACFPDSIVGFIPQNSDLNYLYYNFIAMKSEMLRTATLNTQMNLNVQQIGDLPSVYPPIERQREIAIYLDQEVNNIDSLKKKLLISIREIQRYRQSLITAAITGKIDVREEVN